MIWCRRIAIGEWQVYKSLRLSALKESPHAFTTSHQEAWARPDDSWLEQANSAAVGNDKCILFAMEDTIPIGLCAIYRNLEARSEAEIMQVWVAPKARGSEAAASLIAGATQWAWDHEITMCIAKVRAENPRAIRFYEKCGFSKHGNETGVQEIIMSLSRKRGGMDV